MTGGLKDLLQVFAAANEITNKVLWPAGMK